LKTLAVHQYIKGCFWIKIKFITEYSKAIHTIITARLFKLNEVVLIRNYLHQKKKHQAS